MTPHWIERFDKDNDDYLRKCEVEKLQRKASEILSSSDLTSMASLISLLVPQQLQQEEHQENQEQEQERIQERDDADKLYRHMTDNYHGTLSLKLIHIFRRFLDRPHVRVYSLALLHALLSRLHNEGRPLSCIFITQLKPILVSSLSEENFGPIFKILSRVISIFATEAFEAFEGDWDDLRDFIASALDHDSDVKKGLNVFYDLPLNIGIALLAPLLVKIYPVITRHLHSREINAWILGFCAAFTFVLQLDGAKGDQLPKHTRKSKTSMMNEILGSVTELVKSGKEEFLRKGLEDLVIVVREKAASYSVGECNFVNGFISRITNIDGVGADTKDVAARVLKAVEDHSAVAKSNQPTGMEEGNEESP